MSGKNPVRQRGLARRTFGVAVTAATLAAGLLLGGCGGDDNKGSTAASGGSSPSSSPMDQETARLAYAQCMTEHGIAVDAAQGVGAQAIQRQHNGQLDQAKYRTADAACNSILRAAYGDLTQGKNTKAEAMLPFVRCMREHGVQMADPQPRADGSLQLTLPRGPGAADAQKACQNLLPGSVGGTK